MKKVDLVIPRIKRINFTKVVSRPISTLFADLYTDVISRPENFKKILGYSMSYTNYTYVDGEVYFDEEELEKEREIILSKKDKKFIQSALEKAKKMGDSLLNWCKKLEKKDFSKHDLAYLLNVFQIYTKKFGEVCVYLLFPILMERFVEEELGSELRKKVRDTKRIKELVIKLTTPFEHDIDYREKIDLLKIASTDKNKIAKIKEHVKKYGHLGIRMGCGHFWTEKEAMNRISNIKDPSAKLESLKEHDKKIKKEFKEAVNELKLTKPAVDLALLGKKYVWFRTYRMGMISSSFTYMLNLIWEIGKRYNLSKEEVLFLTLDELMSGKIPDKKQVKERIKGFSLVKLKGDNYIFTGHDLDSIKKIFEKETQVTEVKGTVANRSEKRIVGKARIVKSTKDLDKVKVGDILVSPMTTANFVPAMERAAAFVTDEGGILCHAAIVSREMSKPCIIGTKIATKVFKDGDLVEVDANRGVVKILKRR